MKSLLLAVALAVTLASVGRGAAQDLPARPITMIAPFPPGGAVDPVARIVAERMKVALGQSIVIENVASGGNGIVGVGRVARAAPDGSTIGFGNWGTNVINGAIYALPYDLLNDLAPVALLASTPQVILSRNAVPARSLGELIAWLKQNPDKATLGTVGIGSATHVAGLFFQKFTDTRLLQVPYRGAAQGMQDLLGGQLDLMMPQATLALPQARAGTIRAYAVMGRTRLASGPGHPDGGRGRRAGPLPFHLVGPMGAQGHAADHHRQAQCRRHGRPGGSERARAARPIGPGHSAAGSADPAGARRLSKSRDREVVADHQGGGDQGGVKAAGMRSSVLPLQLSWKSSMGGKILARRTSR